MAYFKTSLIYLPPSSGVLSLNMGRGGCAEQVRASLEASRHKKLEAPKDSWVESAVGPLAGLVYGPWRWLYFTPSL